MPKIDNLNANDYLDLLNNIGEYRHNLLIRAGIRHISKNELVNEGYFGLVEAIEKFDPNRGKDFVSFARYKINFAISKYLRKEDVVEHRTRKKIKEMRKTRDRLQQKLGREPTEEEISAALKITLKQYRKLQASEILIEYIDIPDLIKPAGGDSPDEPEKTIKKKGLGKDTDDCLKTTLTKDEMLIILLKEFRSFTLDSILEVMGENYHTSTVWRINDRAKLLIQNCLENKGYNFDDILALYD